MTPPDQAIVLADVQFIGTIAGHVARKWAASFGLGDGIAASRLERALTGMARDRLLAPDGSIDLERTLDEAAFRLTAGWLEAVLGEPVGSSAQRISAARLAFLTANSDGAWSDRFLDPAGPHDDLRTAMAAASFPATPPMALREIERQAL